MTRLQPWMLGPFSPAECGMADRLQIPRDVYLYIKRDLLSDGSYIDLLKDYRRPVTIEPARGYRSQG